MTQRLCPKIKPFVEGLKKLKDQVQIFDNKILSYNNYSYLVKNCNLSIVVQTDLEYVIPLLTHQSGKYNNQYFKNMTEIL